MRGKDKTKKDVDSSDETKKKTKGKEKNSKGDKGNQGNLPKKSPFSYDYRLFPFYLFPGNKLKPVFKPGNANFPEGYLKMIDSQKPATWDLMKLFRLPPFNIYFGHCEITEVWLQEMGDEFQGERVGGELGEGDKLTNSGNFENSIILRKEGVEGERSSNEAEKTENTIENENAKVFFTQPKVFIPSEKKFNIFEPILRQVSNIGNAGVPQIMMVIAPVDRFCLPPPMEGCSVMT